MQLGLASSRGTLVDSDDTGDVTVLGSNLRVAVRKSYYFLSPLISSAVINPMLTERTRPTSNRRTRTLHSPAVYCLYTDLRCDELAHGGSQGYVLITKVTNSFRVRNWDHVIISAY